MFLENSVSVTAAWDVRWEWVLSRKYNRWLWTILKYYGSVWKVWSKINDIIRKSENCYPLTFIK